MRKLISLFSLSVACLFSMSALNAQQVNLTENYLFDAVEKDEALAKGFKDLTEPLNKSYPWVASFGVATPAVVESIDNKEYVLYQGCKPHSCPAEAYVVMYSPEDKEMVAGAFVKSIYQDGVLKESQIEWLGNGTFDSAAIIGKYLF